MGKEIWKEVEGYEGLYAVSDRGRVKTLDKVVNSCYESKQFRREQILKNQKQKTGYLTVTLSKNKKAKTALVHRLVANAFINNSENKMFVNHINGNKADNRTENLEWATRSENQKHAYKFGLQKRKLRKAIIGINPITLDKVYFHSITEAKENGFVVSSIYKSLQSSTYLHKGYKWNYLFENKEAI